MNRADPDKLKKWVTYLCNDIGRRPASRPDILERVANHLEAAFTRFGYSVVRQPVVGRGLGYTNVIVQSSGRQADKAPPLLIIGAHYDTVSTTPGADDNASGIAVLLELGRLLSKRNIPALRLVAFCPEEPPAFKSERMGSYVYASSLKKQKVEVQGMICLEMLGYFTDAPHSQSYPFPLMNRIYPPEGNFLALVGNLRSIAWTHRVQKAFASGTDLPTARLNAPSMVYGIDFSDHWSFNRMGYPAVMATDTAFYRNPHYHKPSDRPATLDYRKMAMVTDGLAATVKALCPSVPINTLGQK